MEFMGKQIKNARIRLRMSQEELAKDITTQATISLIEKQNKIPRLPVLIGISERLNLKVDELIGEKGSIKERLNDIENNLFNGRTKTAERLFDEIKISQLGDALEIKRQFAMLSAFSCYQGSKYDDVLYFVDRLNRNDIQDRFNMVGNMLAGAVWQRKLDLKKAKTYFDQAVDLAIRLKINNQLKLQEQIYVMETYTDFQISSGNFDQANSTASSALKILRESNSTFRITNLYLLKAQIAIGRREDPNKNFQLAEAAAEISGDKTVLSKFRNRPLN